MVAPGFGTPPPIDEQRPHSAAGRLGNGPGPGAYDVVSEIRSAGSVLRLETLGRAPGRAWLIGVMFFYEPMEVF